MIPTPEILALMEKLAEPMEGQPVKVCIPALIIMVLSTLDQQVSRGHMPPDDLEVEVEGLITAMRTTVSRYRAAIQKIAN